MLPDLLAHHPSFRPPSPGTPPPVAPALPPPLLAAQVAALPSPQILVEHGPYAVLWFFAHQAPALMWELGRLRETTFRLAGEGSGRELDLDDFDGWYGQLILWNRSEARIDGAYRFGITDVIARERGVGGLYTHTLWAFDQHLVSGLGPSLELGRSFVRPEIQRSPLALSLLWRGIGAWLVANPRVRTLLGPVSIDRRYSDRSIQLMAGHLLSTQLDEALASLLTPRTPLPLEPAAFALGAALPDADALHRAVADLEPDGRGLPVLLRQYLRMSARVLALNVDPDFSDVVDVFIRVPLDQADPRRLRRFMGDEGLSTWQAARYSPWLSETGATAPSPWQSAQVS